MKPEHSPPGVVAWIVEVRVNFVPIEKFRALTVVVKRSNQVIRHLCPAQYVYTDFSCNQWTHTVDSGWYAHGWLQHPGLGSGIVQMEHMPRRVNIILLLAP